MYNHHISRYICSILSFTYTSLYLSLFSLSFPHAVDLYVFIHNGIVGVLIFCLIGNFVATELQNECLLCFIELQIESLYGCSSKYCFLTVEEK